MSYLARRNRVVVTGLGVLAPNGIGKNAFWESIVTKKSGVGYITLFDTKDLPCKIAGEIKEFDPARYIEARFKAHRMGRLTQFALAAAQMAIADSGFPLPVLRSMPNVPIVLGVGLGAMDIVAEHLEVVQRRGLGRGVPHSMYAGMPHAATSTVATCLGLSTNPITISTACAAGMDAVGTACSIIRSGQADVAVAGGTDAPITFIGFSSFYAAGMVSGREVEPTKASRPFDADRDSGVISEGAGVVILENLEHALARGANVYAEITGCALNMDHEPDVPGGGLESTMRLALANSGKRAEAVKYVSAHGPGHPVLDRVETEMIKRVFGQHAYKIPVSSIKGATGNALAAAALHQLIACALSLQEDLVPPTTNHERPDEGCDLDYVPDEARAGRIPCAMLNTHGLGGRNGTMIVERFEGP
jgi:3-oxoacyl-[acyl-carrier-protein] synthase II